MENQKKHRFSIFIRSVHLKLCKIQTYFEDFANNCTIYASLARCSTAQNSRVAERAALYSV